MPERNLDPAFVPFAEHIKTVADLENAELFDGEQGCRLQVESVAVESPIELDILVDERGEVQVGSTPPVYRVNTSLQPVFHRLKVRVSPER